MGGFSKCLLAVFTKLSRARPERSAEKEATRSTGLSGGYNPFRFIEFVLMNKAGVERRSESS